jgi:hypothetical protein
MSDDALLVEMITRLRTELAASESAMSRTRVALTLACNALEGARDRFKALYMQDVSSDYALVSERLADGALIAAREALAEEK